MPYCTVDEKGANKLGLWHLTGMDELVLGKWKILEPPRERWGEPGKEVEPKDLGKSFIYLHPDQQPPFN